MKIIAARVKGDLDAMRMISVLPGILTLPLEYQVGRRLVGRSFGILLTFLMAISRSLVWISQDARNQYSLTIVFSLLATLFLIEAVRHSTWLWWGLYPLTAVLMAYTHYYGIFALLAHAAYLAALPASRKQWLSWLGSGLAAGLLFLPWLLYTLPTIIAVGNHVSSHQSIHPVRFNIRRRLLDSEWNGSAFASGAANRFKCRGAG